MDLRPFMERWGMLPPSGGTMLVAVSGGRDSVCLLHYLATMPRDFSVAAAHLDHGQRPTAGRDIIVVEDILDSGNTLAFLKDYMLAKGAKSITIVTLLDKPARREKAITADLAGFVVPDEFVVGYGLDYCQQYRNMPYIGVLKPEVYTK